MAKVEFVDEYRGSEEFLVGGDIIRVRDFEENEDWALLVEYDEWSDEAGGYTKYRLVYLYDGHPLTDWDDDIFLIPIRTTINELYEQLGDLELELVKVYRSDNVRITIEGE